MNAQLFQRLAACALVFALSGCGMSGGLPQSPDFSFQGVRGFPVDVAAIEVVDTYAPPLKEPHIEHQHQTTPAAALRALVGRKLSAAGGTGVLRVRIEEASVVAHPLPISDGVVGAFKREPSERYDANVVLRFEQVDPAAPDVVVRHAEISARRNAVVRNGDTLAEKDAAFDRLIADLMQDVSASMDTTVARTFAPR